MKFEPGMKVRVKSGFYGNHIGTVNGVYESGRYVGVTGTVFSETFLATALEIIEPSEKPKMKLCGHEVTVLDNSTLQIGCAKVTRAEGEALAKAMDSFAEREFKVGDYVRIVDKTCAEWLHGKSGVIREVVEGVCGVEFAERLTTNMNYTPTCKKWAKPYHCAALIESQIQHVDPLESMTVKVGYRVLTVESRELAALDGQFHGQHINRQQVADAMKLLYDWKPAPKFEVGDFVEVVRGISGRVGQSGRIVDWAPGGDVGVEFAVRSGISHGCNGKTKNHHGWYFDPECLKKID